MTRWPVRPQAHAGAVNGFRITTRDVRAAQRRRIGGTPGLGWNHEDRAPAYRMASEDARGPRPVIHSSAAMPRDTPATVGPSPTLGTLGQAPFRQSGARAGLREPAAACRLPSSALPCCGPTSLTKQIRGPPQAGPLDRFV